MLTTPPAQAESLPAPLLPAPRGPCSTYVIDTARGRSASPPQVRVSGGHALADDDLHLALYVLYELHYQSFLGVADDLEWDAALLGFRRLLERAFEEALREAAGPLPRGHPCEVIRTALDTDDGPSLSAYMERDGTLDQMREFAIHRSAYQLKEADPHTWVIPRLTGSAKAALVAVQCDEYGNGVTSRMHSSLFCDALTSLGLDDTYGAYLDALPGTTLATVNLISMFGLNRRLRGALVGHLTVFEMTSVVPMSRYSNALRRLGVGAHGRAFYDAHVLADAEHRDVAMDAVGALATQNHRLHDDLVFGALAAIAVERRFACHLLDSWSAGRTSLLASAT